MCLKKIPAMNKTFISLPAIVITGIGAGAAGYYTYKYLNSSTHGWKSESSSGSSGTYFTTLSILSESEYFDCQEVDQEGGSEENLLYEKVDQLMAGEGGSIEEAYSLMNECFEEMSERPNFLWRFAKVHHLRGKVKERNARELNEKGLEYAKKALDKNPENPEAHKWFAILKGREAEFSNNTQEKTKNARIFFYHIKKASTLSPDDWEAYHLLGVFEYRLADLGFLEKNIARVIFKDISKFSYWEAKCYFEKAEEKNPQSSKETKLFLAKCFFALKDFQNALEYLTKALNMKIKSIDDKACQREAEKLKFQYMTMIR